MDYRSKLRYAVVDDDGIVVLNYGFGVGRQVNPEVAFQYALGLHDEHRASRNPTSGEAFTRYARHFLARQDAAGRWLYDFAWYGSPVPWHSVLPQTRGASVMLRAWMHTGDERFRRSALRAIEPFSLALVDGGVGATHPRTGGRYYEEYPYRPTAVLNGFISSLFGLYEVGRWLGSSRATELFDRGAQELEAMLPHYTTRWWSIYDLDPSSPMPNWHSPRYHTMTTNYLRVMAAITGRPIIAAFRDRWIANDTALNRVRAFALKTYKKLAHR